jgi:hypothetical protein
MPAFTGPPGRSEIPSLRGVLVSSLAYLFSFRITNASPLARCQGLFASLRINLPYASELYPDFNISSRFSSTSALL